MLNLNIEYFLFCCMQVLSPATHLPASILTRTYRRAHTHTQTNIHMNTHARTTLEFIVLNINVSFLFIYEIPHFPHSEERMKSI